VRRFTSIRGTDFEPYIDITAQNVLNREYTLKLFVENDERELHTNDNRTWTPAQRLYVPDYPNTHLH